MFRRDMRIATFDPPLAEAIANEQRRQEDHLELIASENYASAQVMEAYRSQFELGRRSLLDLLNAENELFQARSALVSGQAAVQETEYRVLTAVGSLVMSLGLAPEMSQLDPGPRPM